MLSLPWFSQYQERVHFDSLNGLKIQIKLNNIQAEYYVMRIYNPLNVFNMIVS